MLSRDEIIEEFINAMAIGGYVPFRATQTITTFTGEQLSIDIRLDRIPSTNDTATLTRETATLPEQELSSDIHLDRAPSTNDTATTSDLNYQIESTSSIRRTPPPAYDKIVEKVNKRVRRENIATHHDDVESQGDTQDLPRQKRARTRTTDNGGGHTTEQTPDVEDIETPSSSGNL